MTGITKKDGRWGLTLLILLLLIVGTSSLSAQYIWEVSRTDGVPITNCRLMEIQGDSLVVEHANGTVVWMTIPSITTIAKPNLHKKGQRRFLALGGGVLGYAVGRAGSKSIIPEVDGLLYGLLGAVTGQVFGWLVVRDTVYDLSKMSANEKIRFITQLTKN